MPQAAAATSVRSPARTGRVPDIVHEVLRSSGQPLDPATRAFMEPRFGHDFSRVRVHCDAQAAESAQSVNALAYTVGHGRDLWAGPISPGTSAGRRLIAHELAHVVQQGDRQGGVSGLALDSPASESEQAAERDGGSGGGRRSGGRRSQFGRTRMQRDLATPEPTPEPRARPDLTEAQIREALRFDRTPYDEAEDAGWCRASLAGAVPGQSTFDGVLESADDAGATSPPPEDRRPMTGLGPSVSCIEERTAEGSCNTPNGTCLPRVPRGRSSRADRCNSRPRPGTTRLPGHHIMGTAQSSSAVQLLPSSSIASSSSALLQDRVAAPIKTFSNLFPNIPGGRLPAASREDGMAECASVNSGHREQASQDSTTTRCGENRYIDDAGTTDQANGCTYRGEDFPAITVIDRTRAMMSIC